MKSRVKKNVGEILLAVYCILNLAVLFLLIYSFFDVSMNMFEPARIIEEESWYSNLTQFKDIIYQQRDIIFYLGLFIFINFVITLILIYLIKKKHKHNI